MEEKQIQDLAALICAELNKTERTRIKEETERFLQRGGQIKVLDPRSVAIDQICNSYDFSDVDYFLRG